MCNFCPAGRFADGTGKTTLEQCVKCPVGTFASVSECEYCVKGEYQDEEGQTRCKACVAGKYGNGSLPYIDATQQCVKCPKGTYSAAPAIDNVDRCTNCTRGKAGDVVGAPSEEQGCTECAEGRVATETGKTTCDLCPIDDNRFCPRYV